MDSGQVEICNPRGISVICALPMLIDKFLTIGKRAIFQFLVPRVDSGYLGQKSSKTIDSGKVFYLNYRENC
jgi:hypothetical protein